MTRISKTRLKFLLVSIFVLGVVFFIISPVSVVCVDGGEIPILVRWVELPYADSVYDWFIDKFGSSERRLWRALVSQYSYKSFEMDYARRGCVSLYSQFVCDWSKHGAPGWAGVYVSMRTGQVLSPLENDSYDLGSVRVIHEWNKNKSEFYRVWACAPCYWASEGRPRRHGKLILTPLSGSECRSAALDADEVIFILDRQGLFVRTPGSVVFRGYKWEWGAGQGLERDSRGYIEYVAGIQGIRGTREGQVRRAKLG